MWGLTPRRGLVGQAIVYCGAVHTCEEDHQQACREQYPRRRVFDSAMLQAGSSLAEVGQVLRHRSALTTAVYVRERLARGRRGLGPT